jgi:adenylylsulfate kinase
VWLTGLSASGKTTLAMALARDLGNQGMDNITLLDGEAFRAQLARQYGHAPADRYAVLRALVEHAGSEQAAGRVVIVATISHRRDMRRLARERLGRFLEVYLDCPVQICASRDPKGHYRRARAGEYSCFVGVTEAYETWDLADLVLDTGRLSPEAASQALLAATLRFLGTEPDTLR